MWLTVTIHILCMRLQPALTVFSTKEVWNGWLFNLATRRVGSTALARHLVARNLDILSQTYNDSRCISLEKLYQLGREESMSHRELLSTALSLPWTSNNCILYFFQMDIQLGRQVRLDSFSTFRSLVGHMKSLHKRYTWLPRPLYLTGIR